MSKFTERLLQVVLIAILAGSVWFVSVNTFVAILQRNQVINQQNQTIQQLQGQIQQLQKKEEKK